jgi:hypothetical protein
MITLLLRILDNNCAGDVPRAEIETGDERPHPNAWERHAQDVLAAVRADRDGRTSLVDAEPVFRARPPGVSTDVPAAIMNLSYEEPDRRAPLDPALIGQVIGILEARPDWATFCAAIVEIWRRA